MNRPLPERPEAVIFDWDGVVIDSHVQHKASWERLAARYDLPLPEDHFVRSFGKRNEEIIPEILGWATEPVEIQHWADLKEASYREQLRQDGCEPLSGVRDLLESLCEVGIPCSVGSSTPKENILCAMALCGIAEYFQAITAAEDVTRGKPAPDVFVLAAERVQADPNRCVVIEDSLAGIEAGGASGAFVIGVATTNPLEQLHRADLALHRLDEIGIDGGRLVSR